MEYFSPVVPVVQPESILKQLAEFRPLIVAVILALQSRRPFWKALFDETRWKRFQKLLQKRFVKPRLEAADTDPPTISAGIDIVEGRSAVQGMLHATRRML